MSLDGGYGIGLDTPMGTSSLTAEELAFQAVANFERHRPHQVWELVKSIRSQFGVRLADESVAEAFAQSALRHKESGDLASARRLQDGVFSFVLDRWTAKQALRTLGATVSRSHCKISMGTRPRSCSASA
jgi:hypothetical protein